MRWIVIARGIFYSPDFAALATLSAQAQRGVIKWGYIFPFPLYPKEREGGPAQRRLGESILAAAVQPKNSKLSYPYARYLPSIDVPLGFARPGRF